MTWCASLCLATLGVLPEALALRVRDAIAAGWGVPAVTVSLSWGPLAPTVRLADTAGFRVFGEGKGGRFVVLLRGEDRRDIAVTLRAGRTDSVWVASRSLPAGTVIRSTDLRRAVHLVWGPPAGAVDPPLGWEVRRAVHSGEPLVGAALIEPVVIRAGDRVRFAWERGQVRIVREGIAQARARRGQSVWARDLIRGERLEGIATGPGQARPARGSP